ncbi:MAG TPA: hypothetical protein VIG48_04355 [Jatrophihabitans sp.]|jgi:hypothetical protein
MAFGGPPPGAFSRLEVTPGYKGNEPGHYDPLPGQAPERRNKGARHRLRALIARLRRRR